MGVMDALLTIGDFSTATHLTVKTLRHYHQIGLLEPVEIDAGSGYRRYSIDQIATGQIIRRFRALDMPLEEIGAVLTAPDLATRNELILAHLARLETTLAHTQDAVTSLRDLLEHPVETPIGHRHVDASRSAAITDLVERSEALDWLQGALGELRATLGAQGVAACGPAGGVFSNELFNEERGEATVFVPVQEPVRTMGRVASRVVPAADLATIVHNGSFEGIDRAYGLLAAHVTRHALAVEGPIREYYLTSVVDTIDHAELRTEIGWPIFETGVAE